MVYRVRGGMISDRRLLRDYCLDWVHQPGLRCLKKELEFDLEMWQSIKRLTVTLGATYVEIRLGVRDWIYSNSDLLVEGRCFARRPLSILEFLTLILYIYFMESFSDIAPYF